jgi:hemoglobin
VTTPYDIIGEDGFTRLVRAFYAQVPGDDILGPMYPADDLAGAEERLRLFLLFRFGGPETYVEQRGHPRLRLRHAPFPLDLRAAERWLQLMGYALETARLPDAIETELRAFFHQTVHFLINQGDAPPEPLVTLVFIDADSGAQIGEATVRTTALAGGLEPGAQFRLSGEAFLLVRSEAMQGGDNQRVRMYVQRLEPEA